MSVAPVLPFSGYAGWRYLQRTQADQQARLSASAANQREEAYFRANIAKVKTSEDLVGDRRLLKVALGAFGLEKDLPNKAFLRKVLDGGTASGSLAAKLSNKAYAALTKAFAFGSAVPATQSAGFADKVLAAYSTRQFEIAVGERDNDLRLALNAKREIAPLAASPSSDATKWYTIMGSEPLRKLFETAFGLPTSFATLDIDRQLTMLRNKAESYFGSAEVAQFADGAKLEKLVTQFLTRSTAQNTISTSPILTLLQGRSSAGSLFQYLIR